MNKLAQMTEGFVGEEIGHIVVSGLFEAFYEDRGLTSYDLEKSIQSTVPLSVTKSEQIRGIRAWASTRAVVATFRNNRIFHIFIILNIYIHFINLTSTSRCNYI